LSVCTRVTLALASLVGTCKCRYCPELPSVYSAGVKVVCRNVEEVVRFWPSGLAQAAKRSGESASSSYSGRDHGQDTSAAHPAQDMRRSGLRRTHKSGLRSSVAGRSQDGVGQADTRRLDRQRMMRCGETFDECGAERERGHPAAAAAGVSVGTWTAPAAAQTERSLASLRESGSSLNCNRQSATWLVSSCARRATRYPGRRLPFAVGRISLQTVATIRRGRSGQGS
jgi:hypothetical protein